MSDWCAKSKSVQNRSRPKRRLQSVPREREKRTIVRIPKRIISLAFMRLESADTIAITASHFSELSA